MPSYPGAGGSFTPVASNLSPVSTEEADSVYLLGVLAATATQLPVNDNNVTFEAAPAGATVASIAACITGGGETQTPPAVSLEVHTNGAPGAGETIQLQEADTDADAYYQNIGAALSTFTNNVQRADYVNTVTGKFVRVLRTKGANAVGVTVKFTKAA